MTALLGRSTWPFSSVAGGLCSRRQRVRKVEFAPSGDSGSLAASHFRPMPLAALRLQWPWVRLANTLSRGSWPLLSIPRSAFRISSAPLLRLDFGRLDISTFHFPGLGLTTKWLCSAAEYFRTFARCRHSTFHTALLFSSSFLIHNPSFCIHNSAPLPFFPVPSSLLPQRARHP